MEQRGQVKQRNKRRREDILMNSILNAQIEKKNPNAWNNLKKIGKSISNQWKAKASSSELISTSRR